MLRANLKLCLVPVWVERLIHANSSSLLDILDDDKLSKILTEDDVQVYYSEHHNAVEQLLGINVTESFVHLRHKEATEVNLERFLTGNEYNNLDDAKYSTVMTDGCCFIIMRESGGTVLEVVDELMAHLETLYGLKQVSTLPLFKQFINNIV